MMRGTVRMTGWIVATMLGLGVSSAIAYAGGELDYVPPPAPESPDAVYLIGRLFLITGIMLAIAFGLLWATLKYRRTGRPGMKSGELEYVASLPLDRRCSLSLLKAGSTSVIVGSDASGIKSVLVLAEPTPDFDALVSATTIEAPIQHGSTAVG